MTEPLGWPRRYHPARPSADGDGLDVDTTVTVLGYQLQPGTWDSLAHWCGGTRILDAQGNQAVAVGSLDDEHIAHLGDFVVLGADGRHTVERGDGFHQRYSPATEWESSS